MLFCLKLNFCFLGTSSFHFEDTDEEELQHRNALSETQALLSLEDQVPRYLTSSPRK